MAQAKQKSSPKSRRKSQKLNSRSLWWRTHYKTISALSFVILFALVGYYGHRLLFADTSTNIDRSSQDAVNTAYWNLWEPGYSAYPGWTGSVASCNAGDMSSEAHSAVVRAINFARRLSGLSPISAGNATADAHDQKAALIMLANGRLEHDPPTTWKCYTKAGHDAASMSDLDMQFPTLSATQTIKDYMDDIGQGNEFVGHRRLLMQPQSDVFGVGMTSNSSAIQVYGLPTSSTNNNPTWVSWPTPGYFPDTILPNRWSLSSSNDKEDFSKAQISITHSGASVPVTKYAPVAGYGKPTLVWDMPATFGKSGSYSVTVSNIKRSGTTTIYSHTYTVHVFTPVH